MNRMEVPGPVLAAEFDIDDQFGGLGPGSTDTVIAVKVLRQDIDLWLVKQRFEFKLGTKDDLLIQDHPLPLQNAVWRHTSAPEYFKGYGASAVVYRQEGIVFFTIMY